MQYLVIGVDCPGCGTIKDTRVPYSSHTTLSITTDSHDKIIKVSLPQLKYIDTKRIVYIFIEDK